MRHTNRAFTLIELLVVIGIIIILISIALPSFSKARTNARTLTCQAHIRELAKGWQIYSDESDGVMMPGRMYKKDGGKDNPENWYDVGNGMKYRPRWPATMGAHVGIYAFNKPLTRDENGRKSDRQDYDGDIYICPAAPNYVDERNFGYGYNHQFLGNGRQTNDQIHNFPVFLAQLKSPSGTVVIGDSLGTAAGVHPHWRTVYSNDGPDMYGALANHGWSLDPPRLTLDSDRGTGDPGSERTAVDPRHKDKANVVFADGHAASMTPYDLGYRQTPGGRFVDADPGEADDPGDPGADATQTGIDPAAPPLREALGLRDSPCGDDSIDCASNRLFSGTGRDDDPPVIPRTAE